MQTVARVALAGLVGLACATSTSLAADTATPARTKPAAATHTIVIDGTRFEPAQLSVKRGDSVTWVNRDPFPHTATAQGSFDSGSIAAARSWRFVATKRGRFEYLCTFHPNMKGTLVVN